MGHGGCAYHQMKHLFPEEHEKGERQEDVESNPSTQLIVRPQLVLLQ